MVPAEFILSRSSGSHGGLETFIPVMDEGTLLCQKRGLQEGISHKSSILMNAYHKGLGCCFPFCHRKTHLRGTSPHQATDLLAPPSL